MQDCRDAEGYSRTLNAFREMLNTQMGDPNIVEWYQRFGSHGYVLAVTRPILNYLHDLNGAVVPISKAFDPEMLRRWNTVNDLLLNFYSPEGQIPEKVRYEFAGLAALVAFPLLEEVARRISGQWDEDGILQIDIPKTLGLYRTNSKGQKVSKEFKAGDRIVDLNHKLCLLKLCLNEHFQKAIESLDKRMSQSNIQGVDFPHVTFFERIEYLRNSWLHGRRFEGIEAWLVTFFLAMLYYRVPNVEPNE